jgi:hypothetical protein
MGKLEIRRLKYQPSKKNKLSNFYRDLRKYLEEAYSSFEKKWLLVNEERSSTS